jgi:hypothetical protein
VTVPDVRFDDNGRVWINDVEIPNTGIEFRRFPHGVGTLTVHLPVFAYGFGGGDHAHAQRIAYLASWSQGGQPELIEAEGDTPTAALRALADRLEALWGEREPSPPASPDPGPGATGLFK